MVDPGSNSKSSSSMTTKTKIILGLVALVVIGGVIALLVYFMVIRPQDEAKKPSPAPNGSSEPPSEPKRPEPLDAYVLPVWKNAPQARPSQAMSGVRGMRGAFPAAENGHIETLSVLCENGEVRNSNQPVAANAVTTFYLTEPASVLTLAYRPKNYKRDMGNEPGPFSVASERDRAGALGAHHCRRTAGGGHCQGHGAGADHHGADRGRLDGDPRPPDSQHDPVVRHASRRERHGHRESAPGHHPVDESVHVQRVAGRRQTAAGGPAGRFAGGGGHAPGDGHAGERQRQPEESAARVRTQHGRGPADDVAVVARRRHRQRRRPRQWRRCRGSSQRDQAGRACQPVRTHPPRGAHHPHGRVRGPVSGGREGLLLGDASGPHPHHARRGQRTSGRAGCAGLDRVEDQQCDGSSTRRRARTRCCRSGSPRMRCG